MVVSEALMESLPGLEGVNASMQAEYQRIIGEMAQTDRWFSPGPEAALIAAYAFVIVIGLVGNALVGVVLYRDKELRTSRNLLILNLSLCDILMCLVCLPFSLIKLTLKNWPLGDVLCRIIPFLQTIDVFVATFTIVAIAVDRYKAIVNFSHRRLERRFVLYVIGVIWSAAIILALPMAVYHGVRYTDILHFKVCMENWPNYAFKAAYTILSMVLQYLAPSLVISSLHSRICLFLRMRIDERPSTASEISRAVRDVQRHRRNLLLLTAITVTFSICWLPLSILNIIADFDFSVFMGNETRSFNMLYAICLLVAMASATVNPILYGWFNVNFRKSFRALLCPCCKRASEKDSLYDSNSKRSGGRYESIKISPTPVPTLALVTMPVNVTTRKVESSRWED